jgi:hypothetical protein
MSGEHAKREMVTGEKLGSSGKKNEERTPSKDADDKQKEHKEESTSSIKSHIKGDKKKKKMKKVVYYETSSSSPSTPDAESTSSKRQERKKYSTMPLHYPRFPKCAPLLSVPLGKPPYFDGEDSCMWSDKMRHHLTLLHESIWDIFEFGEQEPQVGDKDYDSDEATQISHFNSQTTSILLVSLCREEYNMVQGLKSVKEIWDILKTTQEGDEVTKITKHETIEGELGRFVLNKGEEPQAMYNLLKTMVNQVHNLGSTKWDDHEMVKVILRYLVFRNPTQVQLIRGDPRYKQMSPDKVIIKFVSFELMIKDSKHIVNLEQGATSMPEVQPVAFKATEEKKEEHTPNRLPIDASKLDNEAMALIIKSFRQILKQRKGKDYKPCSKRVCYRSSKSDHFIHKYPYMSDSDKDDNKKGKKIEKKRYYNKKKGGEAHMWREWDSDDSSTDSSSDEDAANIAVNKGLLFPNIGHKCLMAKDSKKKVHSRGTPKYTTSDDEGSSSDNDDDLTSLFANLTKEQNKKINELIETINEKDDILEFQEDLVVKENKKFVELKDAYALEAEKCQNLTKELDVCNDSISCLRIENASLIAKIEELNVCNVSTSTVEHVTICTRCRDINVDAMNDHFAMIK